MAGIVSRALAISLVVAIGAFCYPSCFAQDARYIVRFKSDRAGVASVQEETDFVAKAIRDFVLQDIDRIPHDNAIVVRLRLEDAAKLSANPDVQELEIDPAVFALRDTNDPLLSEQYSLHGAFSSKASSAWDVTTGASTALVAVIDSGTDLKHPDLSKNIWRNRKEIAGNKRDDDRNGFVDDIHGWDFVNSDNNPQDDFGHGTHVSGIVAATGDNGTGVAGVAWGTKIIPVKALNSKGSAYISTVVKAIDYVTDLKKRGVPIAVMNLSLGGTSKSSALYRAVERARNHDILLVAAAGNESQDNDMFPIYPAGLALDSVISVASTDSQGGLSSFSNFGASSVHLAAPGSSILSTALRKIGGVYAYKSGTSMASPLVAGIVALVSAANPQLSLLQVRAVLLSSTAVLNSLQDVTITGGLVDALAAVQKAQITTPLPRLFGYVRANTSGISGARISLISRRDSGFVRTATSAKDGSFSISELPLGEYVLSASKRGRRFRKVVVRASSARLIRKNISAVRR